MLSSTMSRRTAITSLSGFRIAWTGVRRMTASWKMPCRGDALLVPGVAEVHQFPERVVLVRLDQVGTAIPGDLDVTDESQVGAVEMRQLGRDAFESLDGVDHPSGRQVVGTGE